MLEPPVSWVLYMKMESPHVLLWPDKSGTYMSSYVCKTSTKRPKTVLSVPDSNTLRCPRHGCRCQRFVCGSDHTAFVTFPSQVLKNGFGMYSALKVRQQHLLRAAIERAVAAHYCSLGCLLLQFPS
jgi:hypothetical protein